jgi:hypothetical protein
MGLSRVRVPRIWSSFSTASSKVFDSRWCRMRLLFQQHRARVEAKEKEKESASYGTRKEGQINNLGRREGLS